MKTTNYRYGSPLLLFLTVLVSASLACSFFQSKVPPKPETVIPVSTEAAGELEQQVDSAVDQAASTGVVSLQVTEAQVTSFVALKLAEYQQSGQLQDFVVSNPQIYLRDGKAQIYANVQQSKITVQMYISILPQVSDTGQPRLVLEMVYLGNVAAPDSLVQRVQAGLDEAYASFVSSAGQNFVAENITIADGVLTIEGRVQQP